MSNSISFTEANTNRLLNYKISANLQLYACAVKHSYYVLKYYNRAKYNTYHSLMYELFYCTTT